MHSVSEFGILPDTDSLEGEPWSGRSAASSVHDLNCFLRCYVMQPSSRCEAILNEMRGRFKTISPPLEDERKDLFRRMSKALMDTSPTVSIPHHDVMTLYNYIIPDDVRLPFCILHS